jgi:signal transduction histidine kinase
MNDEIDISLTDLRVELTQTKERLAQEIAAHEQLRKQYRVLSLSLEERIAERTRELTASYEIAMLANNAESLELLLDEALVWAMDALHSDTGIVIVFEDGLEQISSSMARVIVGRSDRPGMPHKQGSWLMESVLLDDLVELGSSEPLLIQDISQDARVPVKMRQLAAQLILAPMWLEHQIRGVVGLLRPAGPALSEGEMALLSTITNQMAVAVQQLELREQVQRGKMLAERERLGRDLHDTITQSLYGLAAMAEAGEAQLEAEDPQLAHHTFKRIGQTSRQALREMRLFIHELRPGILEQNGLVAALQLRLDAVEGRTDTQVRLVADEPLQLPQEVENAFYRVALEALNNTMRHSHASNVTVCLRSEDNGVILEVADDGFGFDPEGAVNGGMGLDNMRLYAGEIGAQLQVFSTPTQGTTIRVAVASERMK